MSYPYITIWSDEIRKAPNYPPHPPIPASRHLVQAVHIQADYQSPEHLGVSGN